MTGQLVLAALAGIATIVVLIVWVKVHPFLALMAGSGVMAIAAGVNYVDLFTSFTAGVGATISGTGLLIDRSTGRAHPREKGRACGLRCFGS